MVAGAKRSWQHATMVFLRRRPAFFLPAWLFVACVSKQGEDADASPREMNSAGAVTGGAGSSTSQAGAVASGGATSMAGGAGASSTSGSGGVVSAGTGGSSGGGAISSEASAGAPAEIEQACLAVAASPCERCLCSQCTEQLQTCAATEGCPELAQCIRESGCEGIACYCGSFDAVACANGEANGPCKSAILDAPGGHVPSLLSPSAGPASDAAVAISACAQSGQPCAQACASR